jgi:Planctomycete extracellular
MNLQFFRNANGSNRRPQTRRPIVENLEGRQLLSSLVADIQKVPVVAIAIPGAQIGTSNSSADKIGTAQNGIGGPKIGKPPPI